MIASVHSGMGANPFEGGVTFRVWAPFADKVCVAGTFNDWKDSATALTSEGNGFWSTDFGAARIGHQYKFVLRGKLIKDKLWKNDPYARSLTNSAGNSIIAEADFDWTAASYRTPAWNEMVIYELHVGSFLFDRTNRGGRGDFDTDHQTRLSHRSRRERHSVVAVGRISWRHFDGLQSILYFCD